MRHARSLFTIAALLGAGLCCLVARSPGAEPPVTERPQARAPATRARGNDPGGRADRERRYRDYIAGVDAVFRGEPTDPRWSSATSSAVHAVLAAARDLGVAGHGVECRSRTCRVEIRDDGTGKLGRQLPLIIQELGRELPGVVADRVEHGGVATMVLYMDRGDGAPAMAR